MLLGKNAIKLKDYAGAINYLNQALPLLKEESGDEWVYYFIGLAQYELGDYKSALASLALSVEKIFL